MSSSLNHSVSGIDAAEIARKLTAELLDANSVDRQTRDDIVLIVQELVVNGFVHTDATDVDVSVSVEFPTVEISVSHDVGITPTLADHPVPMPPPSADSGRGLAIVDRLSTRRETRLSGDRFITTCWVDVV